MIKNGMYFAKQEIYDLIRDLGGTWNDKKSRPIYCCFESSETRGLYWAIPVGNYDHRDSEAQSRIQSYINLPSTQIASCYYHIGNTTTRSIFFISDVIPITDDYVDAEYVNYHTSSIHIVKNKQLIKDLEAKLSRILAYENSNPNSFRQHISSVKEKLMQNLLTMK